MNILKRKCGSSHCFSGGLNPRAKVLMVSTIRVCYLGAWEWDRGEV